MKFRKLAACLLSLAMVASVLTGCGGAKNNEITEFTMFIGMHGSEKNDDNEVMQLIAEKTGVKVKETWLTGQTDAEAVGTIIAGGEYPDFINGSDAHIQLYEAGALIPLDDYIEQYPNVKEYFTEAEWDMFRQEDGHIYWINPFNNTHGEPKTTGHNDEAFWIQAKVLAWAGYPQIETLDDYFKVLNDYAKANPTLEDGTPVIPYTALCEDWRYFCIENAGMFLDGYPNDGCVLVDTATHKVMDYNTTDTTKKYLKKLQEQYKAGMMDPEFATQTFDEYIAKLSTGRVLGMCDQNWNFNYTVTDAFKSSGLDLEGCTYIPLGLTIEPGMEQQWHSYGDTVNNASGVSITVDCKDPDKAFKFISDCLTQEIHDLRFWGVEGVDYLVDENGLYYRTEEMRAKVADTDYKASHLCDYSYFPQYLGTSKDGKNAMTPAEQTSEFYNGLPQPVIDVFNAYGVSTYVEMIGSANVQTGPWYPLWSFSNNFTTETPGGVAWAKVGEVKHEWLPKLVMSDDFDAVWDEYMKAYAAAKPEDFLAEVQAELDKRIAAAAK